MKTADFQVTSLMHSMAENFIEEGGVCIDATMGSGQDTEFLCRCAGGKGKVIAFDIQQEALDRTTERLFRKGYGNVRLVRRSHTEMTDYAEPESVDLILFNLGYLPGGDHSVCTRAETTLPALEAALTLLKPGGAVGVIVYSGGDTGNEEKDAVLDWLKSLDSRRYLVLVTEYYNRPNHPPLPVLIIKLPLHN